MRSSKGTLRSFRPRSFYPPRRNACAVYCEAVNVGDLDARADSRAVSRRLADAASRECPRRDSSRNFSVRKLYYVVNTVQKAVYQGDSGPLTPRPRVDGQMSTDTIPNKRLGG